MTPCNCTNLLKNNAPLNTWLMSTRKTIHHGSRNNPDGSLCVVCEKRRHWWRNDSVPSSLSQLDVASPVTDYFPFVVRDHIVISRARVEAHHNAIVPPPFVLHLHFGPGRVHILSSNMSSSTSDQFLNFNTAGPGGDISFFTSSWFS